MPTIDIKKIGNLLGKGLISQFAPNILRGMIIELFKAERLDVGKTTDWVLENKSLWDSIGQERRDQFKRLSQKIGDISWLNADWAIKALKDDFPAVASLFLGWKKGRNWLERQVETIKKEMKP